MPIISSMGGNFGSIGRSRRPFNLAIGGNSVVDVNNYNGTGELWRVHSFTSNGTLSVLGNIDTFRVLVVAGGGGGGRVDGIDPGANGTQGGGGGAGGLLQNDSQALTIRDYSVTIGTGGGRATNGGNSVLQDIYTAIGGGGGGNNYPPVGQNGGSGGGGGWHPSHGWGAGSGTPGQGFAGGSLRGQGGSARAAGATSRSANTGLTLDITGSSVEYAGGGGGADFSGGSSSNTPGGGGGGGGSTGQSGIVIVAYRIG